MNNHQSLVREFHAKFGLTINDTPTLSPKDDALRVALIREELDELKAGIAKNCRIEIADALADLEYVVLGTAVTYGISAETLEEIPVEENRTTEQAVMWMERYLGLLPSSVVTQFSLEKDCPYWLRGILCGIESLSEIYSIPLAECFEEVHKSNLSKMWLDGEVLDRSKSVATEQAGDTAIWWVDGWYAMATGEGERRWVIKNEIHKAKKSPSYSPADIAGVLARHEIKAA